MSKLEGLPSRLSKIASQARNCAELFGLKPAALGVLYHGTHRCHDRYYRAFDDALWTKAMADIPFDAQALGDMPARNDGPIWVAWWQGLDEHTPPVILACIDSIRRHANGREVVIITRDNYARYARMDPLLVEHYDNGRLTINEFCNALRVKLLYDHGGAWLDATLYLTADLSADFAAYPFYSIHAEHPACKWTTYCLASVKGNPLMGYLYRCFVKVYPRMRSTPEYFMFDEFIHNAYRHIPQVAEMIDAVPVSNNGRFELSEQMDSTAAVPTIDPGTYINKLTYKIPYPTTVHGLPTLYQRVLDGAL